MIFDIASFGLNNLKYKRRKLFSLITLFILLPILPLLGFYCPGEAASPSPFIGTPLVQRLFGHQKQNWSEQTKANE
jgi:hypothetical protein